MTTKLKEITFLTIKNLKNNEIILPGDYLKVFDQIAKELKLDLQDNLLMEKELSYSTDKINKIVEKTSKNLIKKWGTTGSKNIYLINIPLTIINILFVTSSLTNLNL